MRLRVILLAALALVGTFGAGGCANHEGTPEYRPSEHEPAPPDTMGPDSTGAATAPGAVKAPGAGPTSNSLTGASMPVDSKPAPAKGPSLQDRLDKYSQKLFDILHAGGADAKFHIDLKAAGTKIDQEGGFAAMVPIYSAYATAVRHAADELDHLTPPDEALAVHKALLDYLRSLADNLEQSVAAMKAGDGARASELSQARKPLISQKMAEVRKIVRSTGFEDAAFVANCRLKLRS